MALTVRRCNHSAFPLLNPAIKLCIHTLEPHPPQPLHVPPHLAHQRFQFVSELWPNQYLFSPPPLHRGTKRPMSMKVSKIFCCEQLTEVGRGTGGCGVTAGLWIRSWLSTLMRIRTKVFQNIADLDPAFQANVNPFGSGSATRDTVVYVTCTGAAGVLSTLFTKYRYLLENQPYLKKGRANTI